MGFNSADLVQVILIFRGHYDGHPRFRQLYGCVFQGERTWLSSLLRPLEVLVYKLSGVQENNEMNWKEYSLALLFFNILGIVFVMLLQMLQASLPLESGSSSEYILAPCFEYCREFCDEYKLASVLWRKYFKLSHSNVGIGCAKLCRVQRWALVFF